MWPFSKHEPLVYKAETDVWAVFDGDTEVGTPPVGFVRAPDLAQASIRVLAVWSQARGRFFLSGFSRDDLRTVRAAMPEMSDEAFEAEIDRRVVQSQPHH